MTPPGNDLAGTDETNVELGDLLRRARERQGLTVEEIARSTRIPKRHLEALEQNNLAALPPGPYRRGEVLAYAGAVGVDPHLAISAKRTFDDQREETGVSKVFQLANSSIGPCMLGPASITRNCWPPGITS